MEMMEKRRIYKDKKGKLKLSNTRSSSPKPKASRGSHPS